MAKPDYILKVAKRVNAGEKSYPTRVGAGFANRAGGISIVLDPGIAIVGGPDVQVTLWPNTEFPAAAGPKTPMTAPTFPEDDDIPF